MTLIDTSAWVEFLRDTGSPVCQRVDDLLAADIATCDAIRMEVLAGARDEQHLQQLRQLLASATSLPTEPVDHDSAATLYRTCRQRGQTVRKLIDCSTLKHWLPRLGGAPQGRVDRQPDGARRERKLRRASSWLFARPPSFFEGT